jgi:hypothetical protein
MTHPAREFLLRHGRIARGTLLLWSGAATVAALALTAAESLDWPWARPPSQLAAIGIAAALLAGWFVRARGLTALRLARALDTRWRTRAQLESAVELEGISTPWAAAQRDDAARSLANRRPPGMFAWRSGQAALSLAVFALGVVGGTLATRWLLTTARATANPGAAAPAQAESARGTIEWKTPESEIKATAIEEVPLTAFASSTAGFRSLSLEMIVNGQATYSRTLDPAESAGAATAGAHEIATSLYLDELPVKPFDVVSYRLIGELNGAGPGGLVRSAPQLVQIRPPRADVAINGQASEFPGLLFELEHRQIQLLKQTAVLGQTAGGALSDLTWAPENARVSNEQEQLATRTAEVRAWAGGRQVPPLVTSNLDKAEVEMKAASKEIAASAHESAVKTQNRALALLTELEQFIGRALSGTSPTTSPFRNDQVFKFPPRAETPAGELEKLAAEQDRIAEALAGNALPGAGEPASAEGEVATAATRMAGNGAYSQETQKHLATAGEAAGNAARQLSAGDRAAARVPAATAQRALALATEAQEKAGRAAAVAQLEHLRRSLNAATRATAGERAQQLAAAQSELRAAAVEQQRTGSAEAADALAQLAELISGGASASRRTSATAPNSVERAREVADAAAHAQVLLTPHATALSRAVRQLQRTGGPLRGGPGAGSTAGADAANLELASQEAAWIASDGATIALAQELAGRAGRLQSGGADDTARREAGAAAEKLAAALERGRDVDRREAVARSFNPADVDPQYREAVEAYFERLSRDARRGPATVPGSK